MFKFNKFKPGPDQVWGNRLIFWEIELDYDFSNFINKVYSLNDDPSAWWLPFGKAKHKPLHLRFGLDGNFFQDIQKILQEQKNFILDKVYEDAEEYISGVYIKGKEYYKENTILGLQVYKDKPGFYMTPHIDNHTIMFQMIINLTENETGTGFYHPELEDNFDSIKPFYKMTGEKNKGIIFLNNNMSAHSIGDISRDRYILSSTISLY